MGWTPSEATVSTDGDVITFSYTNDYGTNQGTFSMDSSSREILDIIVDMKDSGIEIATNKELNDNEVLIVALYAQGKMLEMKRINKNDDLYVPVSYLTEADTIKAMWWDDSGSIKPLGNVLTLQNYDGTWEQVIP